MPADLRTLLDERVVVLDGGMGTSIHRHDPTPDDWGGEAFVNLSDMMNFSRPEWILDIHRGYFAAGCDAVETNTFNASRLVLAEFGIAPDRVAEFNRRGAELARKAADEFGTPDRPRFVVGSVGPGTKLPSVIKNAQSYIHFDPLAESYRDQFRGLIEGGVDAILIETCFDILQAKCAVISCLDVMRETGVRPVLMVQVTIELQGTMLAGTEIGGALATLEAFPEIDVIGINCATGPDMMLSHVRHLSQHCRRKISVLPNAGIPQNVNGKTHFPLGPGELADWLERFVGEFGINIVGGCCGTTAEHLTEVCRRLWGKKPAPRSPRPEPAVSSLFTAIGLHQEPRPLLVGERTNTNGSKKFKDLLAKEDWEGLVDMAREQEREEAHVIDVCTAYVGRDEVRDMTEVMKRFNAEITRPLMIDSTEVPVIETSLKLVSGKPIINSVNLEDGRHKFDKIVGLARRYGAALVCGCIDEHRGMARTGTHKFEVARRIYDICTQEFGIPPHDLLFDPLVLPVSTGEEAERKNGLELIDGIRRIKEGCPGALTIVGLSNASFGLSPYTRQVLNSVLLHYCLEAGLDSAILHAAKIVPLSDIDEAGRELCRRLIFDDRAAGDPLLQLIEHYAGRKTAASGGAAATLGDTVEERLRQAIIQGRRESLVADLDAARESYPPLDIINKILLDGMKVVGDLFGAGKMQLPFVLRSAEVMKAAVAYLQPFMEKAEGAGKGTIVLATVKGDVHDIGKNLVGIILSNNGYTVHDIGIKQPIENIVAAYQQHNADAIGMSGLLVKSTVVMKEDLQTLNDRGLAPAVILGGAALTRRYVEHDLRALYKGELFYGEDAFEGLRVMDRLVAEKKSLPAGSAALAGLRRPRPAAAPAKNGHAEEPACCPTHAAVRERVRRSPTLPPAPDLPVPPFLGSRVASDISVEEVFGFINERTLISTQWQFRKNNVDPREYERQMREQAYPTLERLKKFCLDEGVLRPAVVYGFFRCAADGDDLVVYEDDGRTERERFTFPRQDHGEFLCLSDYFRPVEDGAAADHVAFTAVTAGPEVTRRCHQLKEERYEEYLYLHGLGVEFAEALAEFWHRRVRAEWGVGGQDAADVRKLFKKHYRGCRYSFGYPACPDLEDQAKLFRLLDPSRIGVALSENFMLEPEQSTSALVVHHPGAKYFNVTRGPAVTAAG